MIVGVFLRNYKIYQNINYVPLSSGESFSGLVGLNGIGKSSVLESLDSFFNNATWIWNLASKKQGQKARPYIVPIFLIQKNKIREQHSSIADNISRIIWDLEERDITPANKSHFEVFKRHRDIIRRNYNPRDYYLIPIGKDNEGTLSFSIFNCYKLAVALSVNIEEGASIKQDDLAAHTEANTLLATIIKSYEYLYIPQDIDPEKFVKLETHEIQVLMGKSLNQIIETNLPDQTVRRINESLQQFLDDLSANLQGYSFRKPTDRQLGLRKGDFNTLIIEHFFETRKLHKANGEHWIDIKDLSSGEKQKAIIDLAYSLLTKYRGNSENLILAIDEPESSLHISACFEQFLLLYAISMACQQLLFSTHWYGFFPTTDKGFIAVINRKDSQHIIDFVSLSGYREEIKQQRESSKGKLPFDIRLKSINDFSQSIIASLISDQPFNWIICEGSSEKIYLDEYLGKLILKNKLRIVPVGGASEIKRIYNYLSTSYNDFKPEIKGKIYLLSDTDRSIVQYDAPEQEKFKCKRIVNDLKEKTTVLVSMTSTMVSPQTEIEDCLNGRLFHQALLQFKASSILLDFLDDTVKNDYESNSYFYLDLRNTEREKLEQFFNEGNNKWLFAKKYVEILRSPGNSPNDIQIATGKKSTPSWILKLEEFFSNV